MNSKSKPKATMRSTSRKIAKEASTRPSRAKPATALDTKYARVVAMLRKPAGATIKAIMAVTEWQPHSVRGFLSGVIRTRLKLNLVSDLTDKGRVYRIREGKASPTFADRSKQAA